MRKVAIIGGHEACKKAAQAINELGKVINVVCVAIRVDNDIKDEIARMASQTGFTVSEINSEINRIAELGMSIDDATMTVSGLLKMNVGKYEYAPKKAGKKPKGWERPYKFHK